MPFPVVLNWQSWPAPTEIFFARGVNQPTLDAGRVEQLVAGIGRKIGKLQGWARNGAQDVLILENWDGALSNIEIVKTSFANVVQQFKHIPSNVFVVDTSINLQWTIWALRRNDIGELTPPYWEIDPVELTDPRS